MIDDFGFLIADLGFTISDVGCARSDVSNAPNEKTHGNSIPNKASKAKTEWHNSAVRGS